MPSLPARRTGRWISPDPMPGTGNKYAYADNNPLSKVDIGGLSGITIDGVDVSGRASDDDAFAPTFGEYLNDVDIAFESQNTKIVTNTATAPPPEDQSAQKHSQTTAPAQQQATPLTNGSGAVVQGANGKPALIPAGFDVNAVVQAGKDDKFMRSVAPMVGTGDTASDLAKFRRGGPWDLQRLSGNFDPRFIDSATILIGMYAAASGLPRDQILSIENKVAIGSSYAKGTVFDSTYTHLPVRNVTNTDIGMRLVQSGAVPVP